MTDDLVKSRPDELHHARTGVTFRVGSTYELDGLNDNFPHPWLCYGDEVVVTSIERLSDGRITLTLDHEYGGETTVRLRDTVDFFAPR